MKIMHVSYFVYVCVSNLTHNLWAVHMMKHF